MSSTHLDDLNEAQREAVEHGLTGAAAADTRPLLVIAGAGSGKTNTLAHRVAHLVHAGVDPRRILLLTFTRRAAAEMTRRAQTILARASAGGADAARSNDGHRVRWSGTFHAIANRLLRLHAESVGLDPGFTVLDRSDSADLMDVVRGDLRAAAPGEERGKPGRFPRKSTCLAIYSHTVNSQRTLTETLEDAFPWCMDWEDELKALFAGYVEKKQRQQVLDYDDLLLYWHHLMQEPSLARLVGERFDHVLVDEYQDTNALQASVLLAMHRAAGCRLTVVGDDAQAIYGFRAADVRNILDFPGRFEPPARVVTLERNYRSTEPILAACNAVIAESPERFAKTLFSKRSSAQKPRLVLAEDEVAEVDYVIERVVENREAGIPLQQQAVLMRAAHHGDSLEIELSRRSIPYVKYGGLKFLEAAHVKDTLCVLRWAENPRDDVAGFRVLQLLPGIGPRSARRALERLGEEQFRPEALRRFRPPAPAREDWSPLCELVEKLRAPSADWPAQLGWVRDWYEPHLARLYDSAHVRAGDLESLEQISAQYPTRERFLSELTLDPPQATGDEAGPPHLDEEFLILSTIHSAKGQEWDAVFVLHAADGCIPSDMATGKPDQIEEERRLLYVAMTRAKEQLHLVHPQRMFVRHQHRHGDRHLYTPRSRFLPDRLLDRFEQTAYSPMRDAEQREANGHPRDAVKVDVAARLRQQWA